MQLGNKIGLVVWNFIADKLHDTILDCERKMSKTGKMTGNDGK